MSSNRHIPIAEGILEVGCEILRNKSRLVIVPPGVNVGRMATSMRFARLRKVDQLRILVDLHGLNPDTQMGALVESLY